MIQECIAEHSIALVFLDHGSCCREVAAHSFDESVEFDFAWAPPSFGQLELGAEFVLCALGASFPNLKVSGRIAEPFPVHAPLLAQQFLHSRAASKHTSFISNEGETWVAAEDAADAAVELDRGKTIIMHPPDCYYIHSNVMR